jgi:glycosyltransferase involved in cell wall biosynthesis/SAM-dependent methyltransferase
VKREEHETRSPTVGYSNYPNLLPTEFLWQLALLRLFAGHEPRTVLDLGCATGQFMTLVRSIGHEVIGVEISRQASKVAQLKGLEVIPRGFLASKLPQRSFNVITAWDFFEHLENFRLGLQRCRSLLKSGGILLFSTPDASYLDSTDPSLSHSLEHVTYLSAEFLKLAIGQIFECSPLLIPFTVRSQVGEQQWHVLIGVVRSGGLSNRDRQIGRWLCSRNIPRTTKLLREVGEDLGIIYAYFQQMESAKRASDAMKERGFLWQSSIIAILTALRSGKVDDSISLSREIGASSLPPYAWQLMVQAYEAHRSSKEIYIAQLNQELAKEKLAKEQLAKKQHHWGPRLLAFSGRWLHSFVARPIPHKLRSFLEQFREELETVSPHQVSVYSQNGERTQTASHSRKVSVITTVKNEERNIERWFESLATQTRRPDEVVLVDGGSNDGTLTVLQSLAKSSPFPLKLIQKPEMNRAEGRNIAIAEASYEIICCTDAGCILHPEWVANITEPFESNPEVEVVAGFYEARAKSAMGRAIATLLTPSLSSVNPSTFLPSARSMAFLKSCWSRVGGFSTWLETGEDTKFDVDLSRECPHWIFAPNAMVRWEPPKDVLDGFRRAYAWARGDGELGFNPDGYYRAFLRVIRFFGAAMFLLAVLLLGFLYWPMLTIGAALAVLLITGMIRRTVSAYQRRLEAEGIPTLTMVWAIATVTLGRALGYASGVRMRQGLIFKRNGEKKGLCLILSGVPISDSGGGQRATQLAIQLMKYEYFVVFVHKFPSYESVNLNLKIRNDSLLVSKLENFSWKTLEKVRASLPDEAPLVCIVEFPLADFIPIVRLVKNRNGTVIYDALDEWNSSLGGDWYDKNIEATMARESDLIVATDPALKAKLESMTGKTVDMVPNAFNQDIFIADRDYVRPIDMPVSDFNITYIGSLWGQWFDWKLLDDVADAYPQAQLILIGDYRGQSSFQRGNVHFLGLKNQKELPAYLKFSHVAIIPWKVNEITLSTNPLKVYEYLAMGKPVVAPKLPSLEGMPYVFLASNSKEFIENIRKARKVGISQDIIQSFSSQNSWEARTKELLSLTARCH